MFSQLLARYLSSINIYIARMNVNVRFNKKALGKSRALMLWGKKYYQNMTK